MSPERLLMLVAAEANQAGQLVPQLGSDQARAAAERLLAAVGLTHAAPQLALPAPPVPPAVARRPVDSATQLLPTYPAGRVPDPAIARQLYAVGRGRL